jgi:pyruvate/2-oxoglutarate/acetoin dehydrogenase E1 component
MSYLDKLTSAMTMLSQDHSATFLGQSMVAGGTGMTQTFKDVVLDRLIEFPVCEDMQLGVATGLSLDGALPVCIFPRINFLILAMGQLVLHLDALPRFSGFRPKIIIRTMVACESPLNPGPQHLGDYSYGIEAMLSTIRVVRLKDSASIVPEYAKAAERDGSTLLVEYAELYGED